MISDAAFTPALYPRRRHMEVLQGYRPLELVSGSACGLNCGNNFTATDGDLKIMDYWTATDYPCMCDMQTPTRARHRRATLTIPPHRQSPCDDGADDQGVTSRSGSDVPESTAIYSPDVPERSSLRISDVADRCQQETLSSPPNMREDSRTGNLRKIAANANAATIKEIVDSLRRNAEGWEDWLDKLQEILWSVTDSNVFDPAQDMAITSLIEESCKRIANVMLKPFPIECRHVHQGTEHGNKTAKVRPWNYKAASYPGKPAGGGSASQCRYSDRPSRLSMALILDILQDIQRVMKINGSSAKLQFEALSAVQSMVWHKRTDNCEQKDTPPELKQMARTQAMRLAQRAEVLGLHTDIEAAAGERPGSVQQADCHMARKALQVLNELRHHVGDGEPDSMPGISASYDRLLRTTFQNIRSDMNGALQASQEDQATWGSDVGSQDSPAATESSRSSIRHIGESVLTECCRRIRLFCMSGDQKGRAEAARTEELLPLISKAMKSHPGSPVLQYEACFAAWVLCSHDQQSAVEATSKFQLHQDIGPAAIAHARCRQPEVLRAALQALAPLLAQSIESNVEVNGEVNAEVFSSLIEVMQETLWSKDAQCQVFRMVVDLYKNHRLGKDDKHSIATTMLPQIQDAMQKHISCSPLQVDACRAVYAIAGDPDPNLGRIAHLALEPYKIYKELEQAAAKHCHKPRVMAEIVRTVDLLVLRCARSSGVLELTKSELEETARAIRVYQVRGMKKVKAVR